MKAVFFLLATLAVSAPDQPSSQPTSRPKTARVGALSDLALEGTLIFEADEHVLKIQESLTVNNTMGTRLPADAFQLVLPRGAKRLSLDEKVVGFEKDEAGQVIKAKVPFGPETENISGAYMIDISQGKGQMQRSFPAKVSRLRLIMEAIDGLKVSVNQPHTTRENALNGIQFKIIDVEGFSADVPLEVIFDGLPSRTLWPRRFSVLLSLLIVFVTGMVLRRQKRDASVPIGVLSPQVRRDQIVRAVEVLESSRTAEKISEKKYQRRRKKLVLELSRVMEELKTA